MNLRAKFTNIGDQWVRSPLSIVVFKINCETFLNVSKMIDKKAIKKLISAGMKPADVLRCGLASVHSLKNESNN